MTGKLTVYAYKMPDGARHILAFPTRSGAAPLLGVSVYLLATHGEVTDDAAEVAKALSDPGVVWSYPPGASEWVMVSDAGKEQLSQPRGGKRAGAGQPRIAATPARARCISLDDESHAVFMALGGTRFLRKALAAELDLTDVEWAELNERGGGRWIKQALEQARTAQ